MFIRDFIRCVIQLKFLIAIISNDVCNALITRRIKQQTREIIITDAVRRIRYDGFNAEVHKVTTLDGYVLTLHRILCKTYQAYSYTNNYNDNFETRRPIVLLLAGIYASSDVWLLNGPIDSLPYLLSRNGFDVWLGNNRGNIYSRQNIWYNDTEREFWNFSWHEMSIYDMPAIVDYIRLYTGQQTMHFVGISQGGTVFLVMNSILSAYNRIFKTSVLLAPVTHVGSSQAILAKVFGPLLGTRNYITKTLETVEMISTNHYMKKLLSMACSIHKVPSICISRLWPIVGYNTNWLNMTLLPDLIANFPVGGSFKQIIHYFQGYMSQQFRQYDYGPDLNLLHYRQLTPPEYHLENVSAPIVVYYAENDYIVPVQDMIKLLKRLRNLKAIYKMPPKHWNHFDFICGLGVRQFIFDNILQIFHSEHSLNGYRR